MLLALTLGAWLGVDGAMLGAYPWPCPAWRLYILFAVFSSYLLSLLACVPCGLSRRRAVSRLVDEWGRRAVRGILVLCARDTA